jgi:acetylornithine deacetylase/succinyl-diaminopimelate desuccinylase-like protein
MVDDAEYTLRKHVYHLSEKIGERNIAHYKALSAAAEYIKQTWQGQGYDVFSHEANVRKLHCENLEVTCTGISLPGEIILVGAHYDTVAGAPGANDNASGVAALLLLSEMFTHIEPKRTVRFVSFVNEEPPFFFYRATGQPLLCQEGKTTRR